VRRVQIDIGKIDKNLVPNGDTKRKDAVFYSLREDPFRLYGLYNTKEGDFFRRMSKEYTDSLGEGYTLMMGMTAGARARFKTDSPYIILRAETPTVTPYTATGTILAMKGFDLYFADENGQERYYQSFRPPVAFEEGYEAILEMPEGMHDMVLYFPMYNQLSNVYLGLANTAKLCEGGRYAVEKPILFYGSSITQGCSACRTGNVYSSILGRILNCDTVNLGISGGAKGQLPTAEYISGLELSAFVYDYDYNAPSLAFLQETYMPFLRIIREKQPDLPIVLVSMISREYPDLEKRKAFIRSQYEAMRAAGDEHIYFVDGQTLISDEEWDMTTTDVTHPNDFGFLRMAEGLAPVLRDILKGKKYGI